MMKKFLLFVLVSVLFVSCGDNPEKVAEKFLVELNNENFEEAKKYADEKTIKIVDVIKSVSAIDKTESSKKAKKPVIEILRHEIDKSDKNKAKVFYTEDKGEEKTLDLVKIDGKWKVSLDKETGKEDDAHIYEHHEGDHSNCDHEHHHDHKTESLDTISPIN